MINLSEIFHALADKKRKQIYEMCLKKSYNISEISKIMELSYKSTLHNLKILEEAKLIRKTIKITDKAKEVFNKSIKFDENTISGEVIRLLLKEK